MELWFKIIFKKFENVPKSTNHLIESQVRILKKTKEKNLKKNLKKYRNTKNFLKMEKVPKIYKKKEE